MENSFHFDLHRYEVSHAYISVIQIWDPVFMNSFAPRVNKLQWIAPRSAVIKGFVSEGHCQRLEGSGAGGEGLRGVAADRDPPPGETRPSGREVQAEVFHARELDFRSALSPVRGKSRRRRHYFARVWFPCSIKIYHTSNFKSSTKTDETTYSTVWSALRPHFKKGRFHFKPVNKTLFKCGYFR